MSQLSRLAKLGFAKESTPGTYLAPTNYLPFVKAVFVDNYAELKDQSYRNNDTVLQNMYQGPGQATWDIDLLGYPDLAGHFFRMIIGPDTVTAGVSTTLSSLSTAGATTISTAASIAAQTYIQIDTGALLEYALVTAVSGVGPYTLTVTTISGQAVGLLNGHASGVAVVAATTHVFKQNPTAAKATWSLTVDDTAGNVLGYAAVTMSDLSIKIDPKASINLNAKFTSQFGTPQSAIVPSYTQLQSMLGWQWTMTNAGAASNRGLTYDVNIKRAVDPIHASNGIQGPREIFQGALEADGVYKALFENNTDLNLYLNYSQQPATATLQQPVRAGGNSIALTMSKSGWLKGSRDLAPVYVQGTFSLAGIYNATDGGAISATLSNFVSAAY